MKGDVIVNVDELIEEVLSLSIEDKINLLSLLKSLLAAEVVED